MKVLSMRVRADLVSSFDSHMKTKNMSRYKGMKDILFNWATNVEKDEMSTGKAYIPVFSSLLVRGNKTVVTLPVNETVYSWFVDHAKKANLPVSTFAGRILEQGIKVTLKNAGLLR